MKHNQQLCKDILKDLDIVMLKYINDPNGYPALSMGLAAAQISLSASMHGGDMKKTLDEISKNMNEIVRMKGRKED